MSASLKQLGVLPDAQELGGQEILRAFIVDGGLSVSLIRGFEKPETWGLPLMDLARHASRIYASDDGMREAEAFERIHRMFEAERLRPTDLGTTSTTN
ncbi:MAG: DUF5076 domain-containing protein [Hyphomicrobiales bacterium]|nr:DUF5076 domain-containing protein [Hyphomicrobiales bacterium]